jgi:outer membrane protein assembly factor BamE (lipoprotein component of BamABCDE complex)
MPKPFFHLPRLIFLILLIGLAGCQARIHDTGSVIKPEDVNKIVVGVTDFREVRKLLGPATIVNSFQRRRWIYIQDRQYKNLQRTFARTANRIEITFDSQGIVEKIERNFGEELIDPEKDPDSKLKSKWGSWFWKGEYDQPGTGKITKPINPDGETAQGEAENLPPVTLENGAIPSGNTKELDEDAKENEKKDWWRFW